MIEDLITKVMSSPGAFACEATNSKSLASLLESNGFFLPQAHIELLSTANGLLAWHGYFRLFGVLCKSCTDMLGWNKKTTWKFAWSTGVEGYLCFGETAWGDQYAYAIQELGPNANPKVYFLDSFEMTPEVLSNSFDAFLREEFLRCAIKPYDVMIQEAYRKHGTLGWSQHITYVPSLLLGGKEVPDNISVLNARTSMIAAGDVASQLAGLDDASKVESLATYVDGEGRMRLKLITKKRRA